MYTIKPGYLVSAHIRLDGGVQYHKEEIRDEKTDSGGEEAEWKVIRQIANRKEYDKGKRVQSKIASAIRGRCIATPFGLICPETEVDSLREAETFGKELADQFNSYAAYSRIYVNVLMGHIASDDVAAAKAIASEMRDIARQMKEGIQGADTKKIREAADLAMKMGTMLGEEERTKVNRAVSAARTAARAIVKEVESNQKKLEEIAPQFKLGPIDQMRAAFLDMEDHEDDGENMPAVSVQRAAALDLDEETE